jgi:hypothetical protein
MAKNKTTPTPSKGKLSFAGPKQVHRQPSAVCPECDMGLVPVTRVVVVGNGGGKFWQCAQGHRQDRSAQIVRL